MFLSSSALVGERFFALGKSIFDDVLARMVVAVSIVLEIINNVAHQIVVRMSPLMETHYLSVKKVEWTQKSLVFFVPQRDCIV